MYNHRKWKSSAFLAESLYPERFLSKHKYARKSGWYSRYRREYRLAHSFSPSKTFIGPTIKDSIILFQPIHKLYFSPLPLQKKGDIRQREMPSSFSITGSSATQRDARICTRGLQEMGNPSFTNGLLGSGFRHFRVD